MSTMSADEPTPQDYATAYTGSRRRIRALITEALDTTPGHTVAATTIPACPDWSVRSLCAHLAGIAVDLLARRNPGPDAQAWVDGQITARADRALMSLLDEWDTVGEAFADLIAQRPRQFSGLVLDVVAHEHDLCAALGVVGERHSDGVRAAMFVEARQILDRDLPAHGLGSVVLRADGDEWVCGTGPVGLTLDLSGHTEGTWELTRLLGSRRSLAQLRRYPWQGDLDTYLVGLAHMPLPTVDLVE